MRKLFLAVLVLTLAGGAAHAADKPNLIIISVDAMGADHVGYYGYSRPTTPNIDRVAEQGTAFMDASALIPLTNPSISTFFASMAAYQTGSVRNGVPVKDDIELMPEILRAHGYTTAAVVGCAPLNSLRSGMARAFDHWIDGGTGWLLELEASMMTERALKLFDQGLPEPFMFYIHFPDPHQPHTPYPGFSFRKYPSESAKQTALEDYYDSEVAWCDHQAGRILTALAEKGHLDNALIIITADHGEHLGGGEKGAVGHGRKLFQSILRIPFIMKGPGIPAGKKVDVPAQMIDFAPTILSCLGLPRGKDMRGRDLMPVIREDAQLDPIPFFFESYSLMVMVPGFDRFFADSPAVVVGIREGDKKIIHGVKKNTWDMYDLSADPHERDNIFDPQDPACRSLAEKLVGWYNLRGRGEPPIALPE